MIGRSLFLSLLTFFLHLLNFSIEGKQPTRKVLSINLGSKITVKHFPASKQKYSEILLGCRGGAKKVRKVKSDKDENKGSGNGRNNIAANQILNLTKKTPILIWKVFVKTALTVSRITKAGVMKATEEMNEYEGEENKAIDEGSFVVWIKKTILVLEAMWDAAFEPSMLKDDDADNNGISNGERTGVTTIPPSPHPTTEHDHAIGDYLVTSYGLPRNPANITTKIMGGSLSNALRVCRSKASMLIAFIPSAKPMENRKSECYDLSCLSSLFSEEVMEATHSKKGPYMLWSAKCGSPEALNAIKRLRLTSALKSKLPVLVVAYPAQGIDKKSGKVKILPKVLAQHHCNPPPSPKSLALFLKALRKRHASQFKSMQAQLMEIELHRERQMNYAESMKHDTEVKVQEELHKHQIIDRKLRREELQKSLPDEPTDGGDGVISISITFIDGKKGGRRRFRIEDKMNSIFDWIDASFDCERGDVRMTNVSGNKDFIWKEEFYETQIGDFFDSKRTMLALRVHPKKMDQVLDDEQE